MPKIRYSAKENKRVGTHSFYGQAIPTGKLVVATAEMLTANNAHSRLGCSVHKKFSAKFATEVQWQKVDANGNEVSDDEEDITQGNEGPTPDPNEGGENEE